MLRYKAIRTTTNKYINNLRVFVKLISTILIEQTFLEYFKHISKLILKNKRLLSKLIKKLLKTRKSKTL